MGKNNKFYYRKKNKPQQNYANEVLVNYSQEQLDLTLDDLKISDSTKQLLSSNHIEKAYDLVKRTEKDMYKVQGLNKKILLEIKDRLKDAGLELKKDAEQEKKPENNSQKNKKDNKAESGAQKNQPKEKESKSKFGLSEKSSQKEQPKKDSKKTEEIIQPQDGLRKVMKGGKWGYSDGSKIVIPTMYDEIFAFKEDFAVVEINEKCGFIDKENNMVIPTDYDLAMSFSEGLALVCKGEKCGYINKNNEVVIPFEYDAGTPFEEGEAKVKKDGKWATLTKEGQLTWI